MRTETLLIFQRENNQVSSSVHVNRWSTDTSENTHAVLCVVWIIHYDLTWATSGPRCLREHKMKKLQAGGKKENLSHHQRFDLILTACNFIYSKSWKSEMTWVSIHWNVFNLTVITNVFTWAWDKKVSDELDFPSRDTETEEIWQLVLVVKHGREVCFLH